jgi:hypothetical protein
VIGPASALSVNFLHWSAPIVRKLPPMRPAIRRPRPAQPRASNCPSAWRIDVSASDTPLSRGRAARISPGRTACGASARSTSSTSSAFDPRSGRLAAVLLSAGVWRASAEEQLGASDDSCRQPALPRSVMAGADAYACRYLPGLRRRTGDVIEFLWNRNGTLPALRPPSTRFWRG